MEGAFSETEKEGDGIGDHGDGIEVVGGDGVVDEKDDTDGKVDKSGEDMERDRVVADGKEENGSNDEKNGSNDEKNDNNDEKNGNDDENVEKNQDATNGSVISSNEKTATPDNTTKKGSDDKTTKPNVHDDDVHTIPPTKKPPSDPSIPRYGKRYRFSYRYVRNQVFEAENETYYPPDHIKDGLLWSIRTELLTQEKQVLQAQQAIAAPFLPLYENLTHYLGTENELDRYVSPKERNRLQKLKGDALTRYRKQLTARMVEMKRRDDRKLKRFRNSLLAKTTTMGPEGVCEGCSFSDYRFHYPFSQSNETVIRKFVGNKEVFSIFTNEHCPCFD